MQELMVFASTMMQVINELLVKGQGIPTVWIAGARIGFNDFSGDEDLPMVGGYLYVACYAPRNYVHVLAAFSERPVPQYALSSLEWQPIACHDSCWRDDGVKAVYKEAYSLLEKEAQERFAKKPVDLSFYIGLESLKEHAEPETVLRSGLSKSERHGRLNITLERQ